MKFFVMQTFFKLFRHKFPWTLDKNAHIYSLTMKKYFMKKKKLLDKEIPRKISYVNE
jgi:hypothetical protein